MELSLLTFSLIQDAVNKLMDADTLCRIAADNGITCLDLMDTEIAFYKEEMLRDCMKTRGVTCGCVITTPSFFTAPDHVENELNKAFELARRMGADTLMVVPGQLGADQNICMRMSRTQLMDQAAEMLNLAVRMGKQYDIRVGFENTPVDYKPFSSAEDCREVLDRVPDLGLIFDTGNFRIFNIDCDELAAYELLKDRIIRVHLKDVVIGSFESGEICAGGQKMRTVTSGSGIIPLEKLLQQFAKDDYAGVLAVEYSADPEIHGAEHGKWVAPYVNYLRNAMEGHVQHPPYGKIPGVGKPVSRVFFGTAIMPMAMGKNVDALLDAVLSSGINAFDCARGYGGAEHSLGSWVRNRNNRERIVLLTKCGNVDAKGNIFVGREVIERELEQSLTTLQTNYIDIYLLHRDDPGTPVSEIIDCLNEMKRQGKIRVFGASNWTHQRIEEANRYAVDHGLEGFTVSSPNYGLALQINDPWGGNCVTISGSENQDARQWYTTHGMAVIAYSSLGRGFFSGKFRSGDYDAAKTVLDPPAQKGYLCEENMERLRRAEALAERDGYSVPQVALRYALSGSMNLFAIVSTTNPSRLQQNIEAAVSPFTAEDVHFLECNL